MAHLILALILFLTAGFGILGARGFLELKRRVSLPAALGLTLGYALLLVFRPEFPWMSNVSILLAGSSIGFLLGPMLGSSGAVLAFLFTAALVDAFSFSDGLTNRIVEAYQNGGSTVLRYLAVFVAMGGRDYAVIGVSDIAVVAAAYLGLRKSTGLEWAPALFLLGSLLAAFAVGVLRGGAPGMPFLAVGAGAFVFFFRDRRPLGLPQGQ